MDNSKPDIADEVRTNAAFEQLVVSILNGAFLGAGLTFLFSFVQGLFGGGFSFGSFLSLTFHALLTGFLIFLIGFITGVIIVIPLYKAFERARRRHVWPYAAVGVGVAILALVFAAQLGGRSGPGVISAAPVVLASLAAALDFGRRMRPHWRAAERAELEETSNIRRLH